jgi:hypothetical protein
MVLRTVVAADVLDDKRGAQEKLLFLPDSPSTTSHGFVTAATRPDTDSRSTNIVLENQFSANCVQPMDKRTS